MSTIGAPVRSVLVTGADGYVGRLLVRALASGEGRLRSVVATDLHAPPPARRLRGVVYQQLDVRCSAELTRLLRDHHVESVVHLAAVVNPGRGIDRQRLRDIEVGGTRNILECCLASGVDHVVIASSGAAYGYYADNPVPLVETDPLRGNQSFAYAHHKRLIEEMLADYRQRHPRLRQLVLRAGTILGQATRNQITALFERPAVLGLLGIDSPFVIIWDEDVVGVIIEGLRGRREGIFNLAGDGVLTLREMAAMMSKPYVQLPARLVERALGLLGAAGLSPYGPEQVDFLRYRPVLSNRRLKEVFGYPLRKSSREAFEVYLRGRGLGRQSSGAGTAKTEVTDGDPR